jgi:hypothetical protein
MAGAQVEAGRVERALHEAAVEPAVGQGRVLVGTGVVDGVEDAVGVEDRDRGSLRLDSDGLTDRKIANGANRDHLRLRCVIHNWWCYAQHFEAYLGTRQEAYQGENVTAE